MISIIVPVYNVKEYVIKCLDALEKQSCSDYEVIVVDDGSTDGSGQLVDDFCRGKERFRVFHKENGGLMSAWKYGVNQANGDYLGFVDSDDYPAENMYEVMYGAAKEQNADIVFCDYYAVEEANIRWTTTPDEVIRQGFYSEEGMDAVRRKIFPQLAGGCISNARWNKIFRREMFVSNMKYCACNSRTFEDRYIVPACVYSAESFLYVKQPLYYYLHREGSNCGKPSENLFADIRRMSDTQRKALEDKGLFQQYRTCWENARIDSVKQFARRNIWGYGPRKLAKKSAKELLRDEEYRSLICKYKQQLRKNGKTGMLLALAAQLRMPAILVAGRWVTKRKYQS